MMVVFVAVVVSIGTGITDFIDNANKNNFDGVIDSENVNQSEVFNEFSTLNQRSHEIHSEVQEATPEQGEVVPYVKAGFATFKLIGKSVDTAKDISTTGQDTFAVDDNLYDMWIIILVLVVSLTILGIIFRVVLV
jgi:hypothetical protein